MHTSSIQALRSVIVTPLLISTLSFGSIDSVRLTTQALLVSPQLHIETEIAAEDILRAERAEKIDAYFRDRGMPLAGYGMKMVLVAEQYNLDWTLIPAIAVRESTGGKFACRSVKNNPFGWGSCRIGFDSLDTAIETIGRNLAGQNPRTAVHYRNKDVRGILEAYNPPSVVPTYASEVMSIMKRIELYTVE